MGRRCLACSHAKRKEIDEALLQPRPGFAEMESRYGLSRHVLMRHRDQHLRERLKAAAAIRNQSTSPDMREDLDLLSRLQNLVDRADNLLRAAEASGDLRAAAPALKELRATIETVARLTGQLAPNRPTITISNGQQLNVTVMTELRSVITGALLPFPDAAQAVARALARIDG